MEEKLYFKPENYGKGKPKVSEKSKEKTKKKDHRFLKLFFFLLFLLIIILVIIWLLKGSKTTSGRYPENVRNEALSCESSEIKYPKITSEGTNGSNLKINLVFNEKETLKTIALIYTLYFENSDEVKRAEAFSHADFNLGLNQLGYNSGEFNNKFASYSDRLIVSLSGNESDIDEYKSSYFMIDDIRSKDEIPKTIQEYTEVYESKGFNCKNTKNQ